MRRVLGHVSVELLVAVVLFVMAVFALFGCGGSAEPLRECVQPYEECELDGGACLSVTCYCGSDGGLDHCEGVPLRADGGGRS